MNNSAQTVGLKQEDLTQTRTNGHPTRLLGKIAVCPRRQVYLGKKVTRVNFPICASEYLHVTLSQLGPLCMWLICWTPPWRSPRLLYQLWFVLIKYSFVVETVCGLLSQSKTLLREAVYCPF